MSEQPQGEGKGKQKAPETIPEFVQRRLDMFNALVDQTPKVEEKEVEFKLLAPNTKGAAAAEGKTIKVTLGKTTPLDIAKAEYPKKSVFYAAAIDDKMWDLTRPITEGSVISFVNFEDERGKEVFWHSSAHILGASIEKLLGVEIAIGPATEKGFFYDFEPLEGMEVEIEKLKEIQQACEKMCNKAAEYERKMCTREQALEIFSSNHYKTDILTNRVAPGELVTLYRTDTFIDLCRGPHLITASPITSWWVQDVSACIWNGIAEMKMRRIRGITFPEKKMMNEHKKFLEEAAKRDHRKLGTELGLFFFHDWSPGCPFFYPEGCLMYRRLMGMIRQQYLKRGFQEVITPNIFYDDLFKTSGHWEHYRDDMFHFKIDEGAPSEEEVAAADAKDPIVQKQIREMGMKPMNCPGHCLIFRSKVRSYKELPMRMAEFGVLHRNEATGALTGLTRVRRFVQDDAHIFARYDQIAEEITDAIDFMSEVYGYFGMELEYTLSTINMNKYMGDLKIWEMATQRLREALINNNNKFHEAPGEAAFYGPKIDVLIKDCLGRRHQLATIQLDFQLPEKFNLTYVDAETKPQRPVMIHRAVLGSLERFIAIAIEHFAGKFPFWMSPRQIALIPQNTSKQNQMDYIKEVYRIMRLQDFAVSIDDGPESMNKKIVNAFRMSTNVAIIIGDREVENRSIAARWRGENSPVEMSLDDFMKQINEMQANYK